jgi:hypothetical protein
VYDGMAWAAFPVRARPARQNPVLGRAATLLESVVNWARFDAPKRNVFEASTTGFHDSQTAKWPAELPSQLHVKVIWELHQEVRRIVRVVMGRGVTILLTQRSAGSAG